MRLLHPTDIATFTMEIAGIPGSIRFYGSTDDVAAISNAVDEKGLIVASVIRNDAMSAERAIEVIRSLQIVNQPVPQPEFDPEAKPKDKLDG